MKTQTKIHNFFNRKKEEVQWDNEIKIASTVKPEKQASYNEVFEHINKQLTKK
jgi:hypothetical protein